MKTTLAIARRQFASYFNGAVAYIVICALLLFLGFFFWRTFFLIGVASMRDMFSLLPILLVVAAPALTMGLVAEEKRTGTIELLLTMPVRDADVIVGKYLGVVALYLVLLLLTVPYAFSVASLGPLDWQQVIAGYIGVFLLGSAMLAIGLCTSAFTENQLIALFVALFICFAFWFVDKVLPFLPEGVASIAEWLSFDYHMQSMARGVVDTRDVTYFLSVIGLSLLLAFRSLESRRWR